MLRLPCPKRAHGYAIAASLLGALLWSSVEPALANNPGPIVQTPSSRARPGEVLLGQGSSTRTPSAAGPQSSTAVDRDVAVLNRSKRTINELYISPSTADQWGDDRLGDDTIDPGKSFHARIGRTRDCEFDMQVVYDDASHEEEHKVNLCRTHQVAFDGSTATSAPAAAAAAGGGTHDITLSNRAGRPIQQVFISPADASQWGEDRLGDDSISAGDQKTLSYVGDCAADLRVVYDNRSAEERRGLDICQQSKLSIEPGWTTADAAPDGSSPPAPPTAPAKPSPPVVVPAPAPAAVATTTVTVLNQSGHSAAELYLFPQGASDRGPDRLGMDELKDGASISSNIERQGKCRFAAHVVYSGHGVPDADLDNVDICASPRIVLKP